MAANLYVSIVPSASATMEWPDSAVRGKSRTNTMVALSRALLPTDSVGDFVLTLLNVAIGSAVQIEVAATGAVVSNSTAATSTVVLTLPAYVSGSASNNIRIKVRKGSAAPFYKPYETLATALVGSASIYVSQISD
jgi:hypothetical protein